MILIDFFRFSSILLFSSIEERGIPPYPKFILFLFKKKQNQKKILLSSIPFLHRKGLKLGFAETANPPVFWYRGTTRYLFLYMLRQPWKANHQCASRQISLANPNGARAWEPTLMKPGNRRVCAIFSCPPNIGGGSRKGWMLLLVLFFAPKKRTEWVWGIPRNKKKVTWFQCSNVVRSIPRHLVAKALCLLAYPFE